MNDSNLGEHSPKFEVYERRYKNGGCTKSQLHRLTELGVLYTWEYRGLTGEDF